MRWQRRYDDLVVFLALERPAHGLVRVSGLDDPLHMRARGHVEQRIARSNVMATLLGVRVPIPQDREREPA